MFTNCYGQTEKQYLSCRGMIETGNRKAIVLTSVVALGMYSILVVATLFFKGFVKFRGIYGITIVLLLEFLLMTRYVKALRNRIALQIYILFSILLLCGALLSIAEPYEKGTSFPVLLILLPLFFIDHPLRMSIYLFICCEFYTLFVFRCKPMQEAYSDAINAYMYLGVSMITHYYINVKMLRSIVSEQYMTQEIESYESVHGNLKKRAEMDAMTNVYNRETFIEIANAKIQSARNNGTLLMIGILDIDKFKVINDTYGHQVGDQTIKSVANGLKDCLRNGDIIGRLGGDEFVFLLESVKDCETGERIMNRIIDSMNQIEVAENHYLQASIGITVLEEKDQKFSELYRRADKALYMAKEHGRNCFYISK